MSVLWQHHRSNPQEALSFFLRMAVGWCYYCRGNLSQEVKNESELQNWDTNLGTKNVESSGVSSQLSQDYSDSFMSGVAIKLLWVFSVGAVKHHATSLLPPEILATPWRRKNVARTVAGRPAGASVMDLKTRKTSPPPEQKREGSKGTRSLRHPWRSFDPPPLLWENIWKLLRHKSET